MRTLFYVILWILGLIGGIMLTGMCERDWQTTAWIIFWVVVGVAWIDRIQVKEFRDKKMDL